MRLYLQYALALKPDSDVVLVQLAAVAEQQKDAEGAIALYRRIPDTSPLRRVSQLQLGLNLADLDRHDEAIRQLEALVEREPRRHARLSGARRRLRLEGGLCAARPRSTTRRSSAIEAKKSTMPKDPKAAANWNIYYQRGIAYERLKQWPKAEPNFRKALELFPNQPQVMNYLGYSWIDMNMNLEEGMDLIRKAVDLRPSDGYIVDSLGWAHYRLGQFEEAVRELERAVSLKPDDPVLNDHLGDAYWRVGRRLEATFQWSHARDMKPEPDVLAGVAEEAHGRLAAGREQGSGGGTARRRPRRPSSRRPPLRPTSAPKRRRRRIAQADPGAYKVQRGQSLWSIAADELGNGSRYIEILNLNPQLQGDPGRLMPGQELTLAGGRQLTPRRLPT